MRAPQTAAPSTEANTHDARSTKTYRPLLACKGMSERDTK